MLEPSKHNQFKIYFLYSISPFLITYLTLISIATIQSLPHLQWSDIGAFLGGSLLFAVVGLALYVIPALAVGLMMYNLVLFRGYTKRVAILRSLLIGFLCSGLWSLLLSFLAGIPDQEAFSKFVVSFFLALIGAITAMLMTIFILFYLKPQPAEK